MNVNIFNHGTRMTLMRLFRIPVIGRNYSLIPTVRLDLNNVYGHSLKIDISKDEFVLPIICKTYCEPIIVGSKTLPCAVDNIICPLYNNTYGTSKRTFDTILKEFFNTPFNSRLNKITTTKGDVYYGGTGIILDKDFNILVLYTLNGTMDKQQVGTTEESVITYSSPTCYVSPKVFENSTKMVEKNIIKKLIPFCAGESFDVIKNSLLTYCYTDFECQVVIKNLDYFMISPIAPKPCDNITEELNNCLVDNVEDIIQECLINEH